MVNNKLLKYIIFDLLRSKVILFYAIFLFIFTYLVIYLGSDVSKALVSILNIVLLLVPLVSIIFGTMYFYNMREFMELLLAQPVSRRNIFLGEYVGLSLSLSVGFVIGTGVPLLIFGINKSSFFLLMVGSLLTFVFVGLSFLASVLTNDKVKGIGISILIWFYMSIIFDGLILLILFLFDEYPLEKALLVLITLNPIDLGRIMILLNLDISVLMGYTGALYKKIFGTWIGMGSSFTLLILWIIIPAFIALKIFNKKDF